MVTVSSNWKATAKYVRKVTQLSCYGNETFVEFPRAPAGSYVFFMFTSSSTIALFAYQNMSCVIAKMIVMLWG